MGDLHEAPAPIGKGEPGQAQAEPIQIWLSAAGGEQWPLEQPPQFQVRVQNVSDRDVWMIGVLPGSEGLRYPHYVAEIEGPSGPVPVRLPEDLDYVPGLRPDDFVRLSPGESFDPQGEGFVPVQQLAWFRPAQPGRYRLRLRFDATDDDLRKWLGHTPVPDRPRVERLIGLVPPVRVWSNTLEIEFD
jgi:hypothetical protein